MQFADRLGGDALPDSVGVWLMRLKYGEVGHALHGNLSHGAGHALSRLLCWQSPLPSDQRKTKNKPRSRCRPPIGGAAAAACRKCLRSVDEEKNEHGHRRGRPTR